MPRMWTLRVHCTGRHCDLLVCLGCRVMTTADRKHFALSMLAGQ